MRILSFENMSIVDRADLVWRFGRYVDFYQYYNVKVVLFSINETFVEVFYSPQTKELIEITVADEGDLNKYLTQIDLDVELL